MQLEQTIREIFWNPAMVGSLPKLVISLGIAALLGAVLGQAYVHFGHSLSNRKSFARNFVILAVTTTLIISIVKSSLALSLGLVGALSIVRFGAAIKEPEELVFLFLAISIGLGLGAGQALVTLAALGIILGLIVIRGFFYRGPGQPNLYLTVASPASANLGAHQILEALSAVGASASLKRLDQSPDQIEAAFVVDFKEVARLEQFTQQIRALSPEARVSATSGTATPSITVTSPNSGEIWYKWTTRTITWSYTGNPGSTVDIDLIQGGQKVGTIADSVPIGTGGKGSYAWFIGSDLLSDNDYRISIQSTSQPTVKDLNNANFIICWP